jgi:hypothetical protein
LIGCAEDAALCFERVLELQPQHPEARQRLAVLRVQQGRTNAKVPSLPPGAEKAQTETRNTGACRG